jgi:hypothetical protein
MNRKTTVLACCAFVAAGILGACTSPPQRAEKTPAELFEARKLSDQRVDEMARAMQKRLVAGIKARYDEHPSQPPVINVLVISGGGDWGAFGVGVLKGWAQVQGAMARPQFDVVTGVSTGALIAPFAYLGDEKSIDAIDTLYRHPKKDWFVFHDWLYFLPSNASFGTIPGLERDIDLCVNKEMVKRVADTNATGRLLLVNTTDIDDGGMWVWDVGAEAQEATITGNRGRIRDILLASSAIPGAFPPRLIDGTLYVDGGATGNIIYGGRMSEEESIPAVWHATYANLPLPKVRFWVIFNNQLRTVPKVVKQAWPDVVGRSIELSTRSATVTAIRHLFAQSEVARSTLHADVEVRLMAIPDDWVPATPGWFLSETMNALADMGEKMGADPSTWKTESP